MAAPGDWRSRAAPDNLSRPPEQCHSPPNITSHWREVLAPRVGERERERCLQGHQMSGGQASTNRSTSVPLCLSFHLSLSATVSWLFCLSLLLLPSLITPSCCVSICVVKDCFSLFLSACQCFYHSDKLFFFHSVSSNCLSLSCCFFSILWNCLSFHQSICYCPSIKLSLVVSTSLCLFFCHSVKLSHSVFPFLYLFPIQTSELSHSF